VITLPSRDSLTPLERYGLDVLVDLSRCPNVEDAAADVVHLEISEPDLDVTDLHACATRRWHIERGDGVVRLPRAILRRLGEIASGAAERRSTVRDRFGRVPSTDNVLVQQNLAAEPLVGRAAVELRDAVAASAGRRPVAFVAPWPDGRRWAAAITHDLDVVDLWPVFTALRLAELARKRELGRVAGTLAAAVASIGRGRNPVQQALRALLDEERARGIVSTWFVLCGTPTWRTRRAGDLTYEPEGSGATAALRELGQRGCEINLHGSFATSDRHDVFAEQRRRLAGLTQQPVLGVRQHFLRMRPGITARGMTDAGFRFDSTWGFPDRNGFRLGTGDVIPAWDGAGDRPLDLQEAPVIWMDRALSKYAGVEDPEAWTSEGVRLAESCRDVNGLWVGVWHPNLTPALGFPGAPQAFAALLDRLLAREPYIAPLGRLVAWRVARRSVRVRGILPDGRPDVYAETTPPASATLSLEESASAGGRRHSIPATPR
jgi:hypothetical protein